LRRDGAYIGENTDGEGFLEALRSVVDPAASAVVVFGAGGAARAIAVELALAGAATMTNVNRDRARGSDLVARLRECTPARVEYAAWTDRYRVPDGTEIVVNATSVGFSDANAGLALDLDSLEPATVVADVIPNPPRTRLIRDSAARGCTVIDGLEMLVGQGAIAVHQWTGVRPDTEVMRRALESLFVR
jgi:shikimate dehydrogenase